MASKKNHYLTGYYFHPLYIKRLYRGPSGRCSWCKFSVFQAVEVLVCRGAGGSSCGSARRRLSEARRRGPRVSRDDSLRSGGGYYEINQCKSNGILAIPPLSRKIRPLTRPY